MKPIQAVGRRLAERFGRDSLLVRGLRPAYETMLNMVSLGRGVPHVVLDRGCVGERWRTARWDSFRLLTPNWLGRLPGWRYTGPEPDGFMSAGEFADYWVVTAKAVHCTQVDRASMTATGYLSPPARGQGKLYNFRLLESWQGPTQERLHGGEPIFRGGHDARARRELHKEHGWDDAPFRLLHACFVRRSSRQAPWRRMRQNPAERYYTPPLDRLRRDTRRLLHLNPPPFGKDFSYRRGELVTVDARPFFRDD